MPAALKDVDWTAIMVQYVAGASDSELAAAYDIPRGTISARACRENWLQYRKKADTEKQQRAAQGAAAMWQARIDESKDDWHQITQKVRKSLAGKDGDMILAKADKVKAILEVERKNYGLDKEIPQAPVALQFNLVGDAVVEELPEVEVVDSDEFLSSIRPAELPDA